MPDFHTIRDRRDQPCHFKYAGPSTTRMTPMSKGFER